MFLYAFISILGVFVSCCKILLPNEKLSMKRVDYNGNELRIDGYYYRQGDKSEYTCVVFLYKNGILFSTRCHRSYDLDVVEKEMVNEYDEFRKSKTHWGVFMVVDNRIEYEEWTTPTEGITVKKSSGFIENDTTFRIAEEYFSYNKKTYHVNQVYHFKQFANKPDSTNKFIK